MWIPTEINLCKKLCQPSSCPTTDSICEAFVQMLCFNHGIMQFCFKRDFDNFLNTNEIKLQKQNWTIFMAKYSTPFSATYLLWLMSMQMLKYKTIYSKFTEK